MRLARSKMSSFSAPSASMLYEARVIRPTIKYRDSAWESKTIYFVMYLGPDFWCHLDPETCFGRKFLLCHVMPLAAMTCHSLLIAATLRSWWSWEIQRPAWYSGWMSFKAFTAFMFYVTFQRLHLPKATFDPQNTFWRTIVNKTNHKRRSRRGEVGVGVGAGVEVGVGVAVSSHIL